MKKEISIDTVLNNLSSIIQMGNFLEEKIAGKLFEDIETMILNQQKHTFPTMQWQTMIWDVCANFEYKELWFTPKQWIHFDQQDELISDKNFDIFDSYAFFKLTHMTEGVIIILMKTLGLIIIDFQQQIFLDMNKAI